MNKSPLDLDDRTQHRHSASQEETFASICSPELPERFRSVEQMVAEMRPQMPVHCLRPHTIMSMARRFVKFFPGDTVFAVKTNPDPLVLGYLAGAGVKNYDVASLAEVQLVARHVPGAKQYFMHPVKSREAIAGSYFDYGVRDFSLDTHDELQKILEATNHAKDMNLYVRLIVPNDEACYSLSGKFGVALEDAGQLLKRHTQGCKPGGVCFHVGSQCMEPKAYSNAICKVAEFVRQTDVKVDMLDVGGGFPSIYPGMMPQPFNQYMKAIKKALAATKDQFGDCQILAEPGRALVAEGGSLVVRVELRKGNALYLNDGTYGSLFDAGMPGFSYPVKAIRPQGKLVRRQEEFCFFGPTCDSVDAMKGPFHLPADTREGDWIEIGQLGSYGAAMRTDFNGFGESKTLEVADRPLLSRAHIN